ncbi:MAG: CDGSH iron-sulfur domain-containing protein [Xanthomonadales bacterium]|nr:CDGSH iron-sulfur domain-containing protein [Xanthomonadales bacterium]
MPEPIIAARKPKLVTLEADKNYYWCQCGKSARQPFCDGSHRGTEFEPVLISVKKGGEYLLCACKHTRNAPWCDGSHNNLEDSYEEASTEEIAASAHLTITPRDGISSGKALLDGGCFVQTLNHAGLQQQGNIAFSSMINAQDGANCLSLYYLEAGAGKPAVLAFPGSSVAVFVLAGEGLVTISGKAFEVQPEQGLYIGPKEAFSVQPTAGTATIKLTITLCPQSAEPQWLDKMPDNFDAAVSQRIYAVDPAKREVMADRFYQVLIDDRIGAADMTQFVGEVPRSRAAGHHHLYEETITILSGSGYLWTEGARAEVQPGDIIFLPRRQLHSLECSSDEGMRLVGVFFPAGSPAINY